MLKTLGLSIPAALIAGAVIFAPTQANAESAEPRDTTQDGSGILSFDYNEPAYLGRRAGFDNRYYGNRYTGNRYYGDRYYGDRYYDRGYYGNDVGVGVGPFGFSFYAG